MGGFIENDITLVDATADITRELPTMDFSAFVYDSPQNTPVDVIIDMAAKWALSHHNWRNAGEFLLNYSERVYEMTAPFVRNSDIEHTLDTPAKLALKQAQWDMWGEMVGKFLSDK